MATQTFENISKALSHLTVIRQATSDPAIVGLCRDAAAVIAKAVDDAVIVEGVDPAADLRKISYEPFYNAIDECKVIADASSSPLVKASCMAIVQSLNGIIYKLI